jgi:hypothetical protein
MIDPKQSISGYNQSAEQLFKGYDVFRANPEGEIYNSQFGMPLPAFEPQGEGYGRFDAVTSGLQAGDMVLTQGHAGPAPAPRAATGCFGQVDDRSGSGNSGDDHYVGAGIRNSRSGRGRPTPAAAGRSPQEEAPAPGRTSPRRLNTIRTGCTRTTIISSISRAVPSKA